MYIKNRTAGLNHSAAILLSLGETLVAREAGAAAREAGATRDAGATCDTFAAAGSALPRATHAEPAAAFGVFGGLEITNFDVFL